MSIIDYHARVIGEGGALGVHEFRAIQTDVIDAALVSNDPGSTSRDFVIESQEVNVPIAVAALLDITTNVGSAIVNDVTSIVADPTNTKFVLVSVVRDDGTGLLEIQVQEKTTGSYAPTPAGKTWECDIAEFSVSAAGTALVEV